MTWSKEKTSALRRMFADGSSDAEIAKALGVTGRSVIGKRYRLELFRMPSGLVRDDPYAMAIRRAEKERAKEI